MPQQNNRDSFSISEKEAQQKDVEDYIMQQGFIPKELVADETAWFYEQLGIDDNYFLQESVEAIAGHITLLYSAKMDATVQNSRNLEVDLQQEWDDKALYIHTTVPGAAFHMHKADHAIDDKYLDHQPAGNAFRVESYLSTGMASHNMKTHLQCFFVNKCNFLNTSPNEIEARDILQVSDPSLFGKISEDTKARYQALMVNVLDQLGVATEVIQNPRCDYQVLSIAYKRARTEKFLTAITDLYHYYGFCSKKMFLENFLNGVSILTLYLIPITSREVDEESIAHVVKEISMLYAMPNSPLHSLFRQGMLNAQETMYATSAFIFAQHFLNRLGQEYWDIKDLLGSNNPHYQLILGNLQKRLRSEAFTVESVKDIVLKHPKLIKILYINFAVEHYLKPSRNSVFSTSLYRSSRHMAMGKEELLSHIKKSVSTVAEIAIFQAFVTFNESVVKTNFYNPSKASFAYHLKCDFLPVTEYPLTPYGIYLIIGNEFRGFHVRFQDIARGGIRIVRSRNAEIYGFNRRYLFDENYALASTQTRKNKDIPEGGSKGTILLEPDRQEAARVAFEKYIDAMLDLLVSDKSVSKKSRAHPEILFFGPDEGTADFMDWASEHSKKRGLKYWKAITTGKSQERGGIPHDTYGMTTRSVNRYVRGIYRKLGKKEEEITKFQTGGPDGDLGSNEIKMSKDLTIGVVDGSGVLYDPEGINRKELLRLASERKMISSFNTELLSAQGFRVLVDESHVTLPDGTEITSGVEFRNTFHLNDLSTADLFVPCGGRPESVDIGNYQELLWEDGTPRFNYIVEGANLFFTQEARVRLEKAGCIIFKDASANKGGVTSSSLEVLAALALTDEEFEECMAVKNGVIPPFYTDYVMAVQDFIAINADLEFECIWRESARFPEKTKAEISDELSLAILDLNIQLQEDEELWSNEELRDLVMAQALPRLLQDKVGGIEALLKRLPVNYQKAVFGSFLASRFIYAYGVEPSQMAFFEYMAEYMDIGTKHMSLEHRLQDTIKDMKLV